jgi:hypothetical protein
VHGIPALGKETVQHCTFYAAMHFLSTCMVYLHSVTKLGNITLLRGNALLSHMHGMFALRKEAGQYCTFTRQCTYLPRAMAHLRSVTTLGNIALLRGNALLSHVHGIPALRNDAVQHCTFMRQCTF